MGDTKALQLAVRAIEGFRVENVRLQAAMDTLLHERNEREFERDEARWERNVLGGFRGIAQRWLVRGRHLLTSQRKQTKVAERQAAKYQSEYEKMKAALVLARHKVEQTLAGQYPEGQALRAALFAINQVIPREQSPPH